MSFFDTHTKAELITDVFHDYGIREVCGACWWLMVHDPPTQPGQRCMHGHPLKWLDETRDPELGLRDCHDDGSQDE